ncbi:hypothetical protein JAK53_10485 [Stenotrophomonas maltophilia]|uniref:hypothetical protein n=1 Tax=Stenotrophomonas TaxID=40323 RepID=UPI0018D2C45E|nr:hypothetical protein [Stenotrophomonas maltophilia]MBH1816832.1 hypothetical protein [Stenotrophomonas maltophilia]MCU1029707.1 hypothetical protein [Stenotrophomonas maltophilia]
MSILNVLLRADQLLVAVDTLAEDALTGAPSAGAKLLLIPQHNLVLATRGSAQFFLRIYELTLQASFRANFTMEQLGRELGMVVDQLWPAYEKAAREARVAAEAIGAELVLGGWSSEGGGRMVATAYAKSVSGEPTRVQPLVGGLASPGDPLRGRKDSFDPENVLEAGRLQADWLNRKSGRQVAGGRLFVAALRQGHASIQDLGGV